MIDDAELKKFNSLCMKYFGYTASFIKYKLTENDTRLDEIERSIQNLFPILTASVLKGEAIETCLSNNRLIKKEDVVAEMDNIASTMPNNKRLN